eukprot:CAMPEP_0119033718 /NCGR_PEP_ID=MMETSP1177-20130426/780_1 /TAXON_ID=2985 /ORGANISM="Ochromonas sp, Strain CCMP1899" /LENGTH=67 /DNA_ID=CAMNT_0006990677 /DNA_START=86 /DNA_END=286 /DNA_ORIENTATION=+
MNVESLTTTLESPDTMAAVESSLSTKFEGISAAKPSVLNLSPSISPTATPTGGKSSGMSARMASPIL